MFFLLEWNIRNQRHDKSLSVYTHFLLTLRAPYNWARIWQRYRGAHWKLYLSASNNMNYYNFTKQTTHKCVYYTVKARPKRKDMIWKKNSLSSVLFACTLSHVWDRERDMTLLYIELSFLYDHFCVCTSACTQKNRYQFSMRYLWNVISSFYLLLLLLECMQARNGV